MKNWKEERNYRTVKNDKGEVIAHIITIDGKDIPVSEEVFRVYSQMDRRERYQEERQGNHPQVSLDMLRENYVPLDLYIKNHALSAEEMLLQKEDKEEAEQNKIRLLSAMQSLTGDERALLHALYAEGLSAREYAKRLGVYHRTVLYHRDKVLKKLRQKISG